MAKGAFCAASGAPRRRRTVDVDDLDRCAPRAPLPRANGQRERAAEMADIDDRACTPATPHENRKDKNETMNRIRPEYVN